MKKIIVLLLFLAITLVLFSQTDIYEGDVSGNWDLGGSPYIINGNITIPNGETLTIEPGVNIQYNGSFTLTVLGRLLAVGTQTDSIIFIGNNNSNSDNAGIYFNNVSTENDSSRFAYCRLENFEYYAIKIENSSKIDINNCDVTKIYVGGGILILSSSVSILNTKIHNNTLSENTDNYKYSGISVYNSNIKLINCLIYRNEFYIDYSASGNDLYQGNGLYGDNSDIYLLNCTFADNPSFLLGQDGMWYEHIVDSAFSDIKITNQSNLYIINSIIWDQISFPFDSNDIKSIIANNQSNIDIYYSDVQHYVNNPNNDDCIVLHDESTLNWNGSSVNLNPEFIDPSNFNYKLSETSPCIDSGTLDYPSDCEIPANDLEGNNRIFNDAFSKIDMGAYEYQGTPNTNCEIYAMPSTLYWGYVSVNPPYPEKTFTIHNIGYTPLNINGVLSSNGFFIRDNSADEYSNYIDSFTIPPMGWKDISVEFRPQNSGSYNEEIGIYLEGANVDYYPISVSGIGSNATYVGGTIENNTNWEADTLLVNNNITISENATVTIQPGTKILFTGPYYINVLGNIVAEGEQDNRIIFSKVEDNYWHGIRFVNTPESSDSSKFVYCDFEYAKADFGDNTYDGGIYISGFTKVKFSHCNFLYNKRENGGALYIKDADNIVLDDCIFSHNDLFGNCGGAIYAENSNLTIRNCDINHNLSDFDRNIYFGGGIYCKYTNLNIESSKIDYNGLVIEGYFGDSHLGGGLYAEHSNININNSSVSFNSTQLYSEENPPGDYQQHGGGLYIKSCNINIINSDIVSNPTNMEQLFIVNNSSCSIINSVLFKYWDTFGIILLTLDNNSYCQISYSDIQDGQDHISVSENSSLDWSDANISSDPLFIDSNSNLHLLENSPLINAGTPDTTGLNIPAYDLDGNPRIYQDRIDIGCYEWQGVHTNNNNLHPAITKLYANYPNPFNPTTTISFSSPNEENVSLTIYNLKGQKVKTLIDNKSCKKGLNKIVWNGKNNSDKKVSSGIYFYKLKTKDKTLIRKMIMLK